jgi:hypothetical protein
MSLVAGADACRGGWVAVVAENGRFTDSVFAPSFATLLEGLREAELIGVDIPIGLPIEGVRAADAAARAFVGPRRASSQAATCATRSTAGTVSWNGGACLRSTGSSCQTHWQRGTRPLTMYSTPQSRRRQPNAKRAATREPFRRIRRRTKAARSRSGTRTTPLGRSVSHKAVRDSARAPWHHFIVRDVGVRDQQPRARQFLIRFLTCVVLGHQWDPYPGHLRDEGLMECARCGMRARPVQGLRT